MTWFADKLGPMPPNARRNAAAQQAKSAAPAPQQAAPRQAPPQPQQAAPRSVPQAAAQARPAAPPPPPEPDKKKKKGWF